MRRKASKAASLGCAMFRNIYILLMNWLVLVTTQNMYQPLNSNFFSSAIATYQNPPSVSRVEKYFCSAEAINSFTYSRSLILVVNNFDRLTESNSFLKSTKVATREVFLGLTPSKILQREVATLSPSKTSLLFSQNFVN